MAGYYRAITIDHTKCGASNSSSFPMLFSGTYSWLATVANGGKVQNANGYDICFYSDSALTTKLDFERVKWSASTGACEFWVRIPTLSSSADTVIYIGYGNSAITTDQQAASSVWDSNFVGVYHMGDGSTLSSADSTANANNGTATSVSAASGQVGGAASFNGSSSHIDIGSALSLQFTSAFTLSAWVKCNNFTTWRSILGKQAAGGNPKPFDWYIQGSAPYDGPTGRVTLYYGTGSAGYFHSSTTPLTANTWQLVQVTVNGSSIKHYLNGAADGTGTNSYTLASGTEHIQIGSRSNLDIWMDGYLDEVRISNSERSANWLLVEYNNQSSPSTFYALGAETGGNAAYTMAATAGSFSLSGVAAGFKVGRMMAATAASYAVSATATAFKVGRVMAATAASYSLSAIAMAFKVGRKMLATAASYNISATATAFKVGRTMSAAAGSYAISGVATAFKVGRKMTAAAGALTLSATATAFRAALKISATAAGYTLSGVATAFNVGRKMVASTAAYNISATATAFKVGRKMQAVSGSYIILARPASFIIGVPVYSVSGKVRLLVTSQGYTVRTTAGTRVESTSGGAIRED